MFHGSSQASRNSVDFAYLLRVYTDPRMHYVQEDLIWRGHTEVKLIILKHLFAQQEKENQDQMSGSEVI